MTKMLLTLVLTTFSIAFVPSKGYGQTQSKESGAHVRTSPKLVVGIVVDQMRYDYIPRFYHRFGEGGFKRLVDEGFNCKNNHFNYAPTSTGPGHASVYTGTTPATHGILGNNWYEKASGTDVYCAGDDSYASVGTDSDAGQMSPHRMEVTTITDQLRLSTQMRGKTIAIAIKDRGAVLPGGHTANAAYWFHGSDEGKFITSTYYMPKLPKWVDDFNASDAAEKYKKPWTTLKPIEKSGQILIQTQVYILYLFGIYAISMANIIGAGKTDGQKIRIVVGTQVFLFQRLDGKVRSQTIAVGSCANHAEFSVLVP